MRPQLFHDGIGQHGVVLNVNQSQSDSLGQNSFDSRDRSPTVVLSRASTIVFDAGEVTVTARDQIKVACVTGVISGIFPSAK
jgi:hypothetical protein